MGEFATIELARNSSVASLTKALIRFLAAYQTKYIYSFICLLFTGSEPKISFIVWWHLLPRVIGEGTFLSMAPAGAEPIA